VIRPAVWSQYANVTDRQTDRTGRTTVRYHTDIVGRTVLETVARTRVYKHVAITGVQVSAISLGVASSGECLRDEGLMWLIEAVVCLLAATAGPMSVRAMDGRICSAAPLALAKQLPLPTLLSALFLVYHASRAIMRTRPLPVPLLFIVDVPPLKRPHVGLSGVKPNSATEWRGDQMKMRCRRLGFVQSKQQDVLWYRYFVSDERRYVYCCTPKVACSSWKLALLRLTGKDISRVKNVHILEQSDKFIKRVVHYSVSRRQALLKKYYKFMFVREPLERLVSAFRFRYSFISREIRRRRQSMNSQHAGKTANAKRHGFRQRLGFTVYIVG